MSEEGSLALLGMTGLEVNKRGTMAKKRKELAKILKSKMVYQGPVFGVRRDEVLEPGGLQTTREVITHPGSVVVLPVLRGWRES